MDIGNLKRVIARSLPTALLFMVCSSSAVGDQAVSPRVDSFLRILSQPSTGANGPGMVVGPGARTPAVSAGDARSWGSDSSPHRMPPPVEVTPRRADAPSSPSPSSESPEAGRPARSGGGLAGLTRTRLDRGRDLAMRGAFYSARSEFLEALQIHSRASDARTGGRRHGDLLNQAMRALEEADDFEPSGSELDADLQLEMIIQSHRTPVLKGLDLTETLPATARNRYLAFAGDRLAAAFGGSPDAAHALYGLGRIHTSLAERPGQGGLSPATNCLRAIVFHQAALAIDPDHASAANELGVLLARHGQLESARRALVHSVTVAPTARALRNLAAVYRKLGRAELASEIDQRARGQAGESGIERSRTAPEGFRFVSLEAFARTGSPNGPLPSTTGRPGSAEPESPPTRDVPPPTPSKDWWQFWKR